MAKEVEELDPMHELGMVEAGYPPPPTEQDPYVEDPNYNTDHDKLDPNEQGGV